MPIEWIFFDLGWTLVDETEAHDARFDDLRPFLRDFGIRVSRADFIGACQAAASEFASSPFIGALRSLGLSETQVSLARSSVGYPKAQEHLYEGVPELLRNLAKSYRLGVIANQSPGTVERLKAWGIESHFSCIFASAEAGLSKPDPRIFEQALLHTRCSAEQALMVGDRLDNDIAPAKRGGWQTVRVLQGFSQFQQPRSEIEEPHVTMSSVTELQGYL